MSVECMPYRKPPCCRGPSIVPTPLLQAPESTVNQPCGSLSAGNIRRIFGRIFEMPCAEWYTSVDSRQPSTVELKSKASLAVDSGACPVDSPNRAAGTPPGELSGGAGGGPLPAGGQRGAHRRLHAGRAGAIFALRRVLSAGRRRRPPPLAR
eukprot:9150-Prorocentrum_minimum.AAC.1